MWTALYQRQGTGIAEQVHRSKREVRECTRRLQHRCCFLKLISLVQVRDIFSRAVAAKPCVLFFDEFDSLAPKR